MEQVQNMARRHPGRPPLGEESLMTPRTIRLPRALLEEIDAIREARPLDRPEFGQIVRELLAEAVTARKTRRVLGSIKR